MNRVRVFTRTSGLSRLCLTVVACGCLPGCTVDHRAASSTDSWFNPPTREFWEDSTRPSELDRSKVHPVVQGKESEAEQRLVTQAAVELTEREASAFVDEGFQGTPGTKVYLVRGVYLNSGGRFSIEVRPGNDVCVGHYCLGHHAVPMRRQAVVLELESPPRNVYVTCGMVE